MKHRPVWGKITNIHLYALVGVYFLISLAQVGLPENFENSRNVLTLFQLVLLVVLSVLLLINLVRNWE